MASTSKCVLIKTTEKKGKKRKENNLLKKPTNTSENKSERERESSSLNQISSPTSNSSGVSKRRVYGLRVRERESGDNRRGRGKEGRKEEEVCKYQK